MQRCKICNEQFSYNATLERVLHSHEDTCLECEVVILDALDEMRQDDINKEDEDAPCNGS
jgi:hypothetical protein